MALEVERFSIPPEGIDIVDITLKETYNVEGVGEDTILLTGELEAHRTAPMIGHGEKSENWESTTVAAVFTNLSVTGESKLFGPVRVTLDRSMPSMGVVKAGKCNATMSLRVTMPKLGITLVSARPVQLQSQVETVPPIGDERTESIMPVELVDIETKRVRGRMEHAVVAWRDLMAQEKFVR